MKENNFCDDVELIEYFITRKEPNFEKEKKNDFL
jgi:hypothetical protein